MRGYVGGREEHDLKGADHDDITEVIELGEKDAKGDGLVRD